jgi:hypothetical protein
VFGSADGFNGSRDVGGNNRREKLPQAGALDSLINSSGETEHHSKFLV